MSWIAKTLHVTPTGRAKSSGSTTRRSQSVKQTKYAKGKGADRPLGFEHACHPQALTRTPVHPGCATDMSSYNVSNWAGLTVEDFVEGAMLISPQDKRPGDWAVSWPSGQWMGYLPPSQAMQYKRAAARMGVRLNVYQPEV
ncbi:MAG: hypothetical protein ACYS76_16475 [Planctomycetota bacterium]|jgi:hypothetical protein